MNDVYRSAEFQSLYTMQRRLGARRVVEEHPYRVVFAGLSSLRGESRRRRRLVLRFRASSA